MKVKDLMSKNVKVINVKKSIKDAALMMQQTDCGSIPVEENEKLMGMVTDRDIALWVANTQGSINPSSTSVKDCMNEGIMYCYEEDEVDSVIDNMAEMKRRRMPVMSRDKKLVGIISLGDIASQTTANSHLEKAFQRISA